MGAVLPHQAHLAEGNKINGQSTKHMRCYECSSVRFDYWGNRVVVRHEQIYYVCSREAFILGIEETNKYSNKLSLNCL